ncbi:hypothetical protein ACQ3I4_11185 [Zafaria sp. Z1313]|uniref:hypothetical protein n=1 Tax=Zafaria sp. Z1313 TaxID=3423202 RepID=UPI003D3024A6
MTYVPRRAASRFLDGDCPAGVLAIFDSGPGDFDRWTVFYRDVIRPDGNAPTVGYRAMSADPFAPGGVGVFGEMQLEALRDYRRANRRRSARWSDLPEQVKRAVRADLG